MFDSVDSYYQFHSKIYDLTRWSILFGRNIIYQHLPKLSNDDIKILDLGCGTGHHLLKLAKKYPTAKIIGLDASKEMLSKASNKIQNHDRISVVRESSQTFLINPEEYDLIFCSYSLSMIKNYSEFLIQLRYSLKQNGIIAIVDFNSTPLKFFERWMNLNHVSINGKLFEELRSLFKPKSSTTKSGYVGLWSYTIFIGER